jgi:AcrR family transcriptional regulator
MMGQSRTEGPSAALAGRAGFIASRYRCDPILARIDARALSNFYLTRPPDTWPIAKAAFAEADSTNTSVSMDGIARKAGVGVATLYRHFPTRDKLAEAVYLRKLDEFTSESPTIPGSTGAVQLRDWMHRYAEFMLSKRGMMDTVRAAWISGTASDSDAAMRIRSVIGAMLANGAADGSLREAIRADDVTAALLGLLTAASPDDERQATRLIYWLLTALAG